MATRIPEEMRCIMGEIFQLLCVFLPRTCDADRHCLLRHKHSVTFSAQTHTHTNTYTPSPPFHTQRFSLCVCVSLSLHPFTPRSPTAQHKLCTTLQTAHHMYVYMYVSAQLTGASIFYARQREENETKPQSTKSSTAIANVPCRSRNNCQGSEYNWLR